MLLFTLPTPILYHHFLNARREMIFYTFVFTATKPFTWWGQCWIKGSGGKWFLQEIASVFLWLNAVDIFHHAIQFSVATFQGRPLFKGKIYWTQHEVVRSSVRFWERPVVLGSSECRHTGLKQNFIQKQSFCYEVVHTQWYFLTSFFQWLCKSLYTCDQQSVLISRYCDKKWAASLF